MLDDGFLNGVLDVWTLAFDHGKRNAVDEQHNIRPSGLVATRTFDAELFGDVKDVVLPVVPVDVVQRETLGVALDGLLHAPPQAQQVLDFLIGSYQAGSDYLLD